MNEATPDLRRTPPPKRQMPDKPTRLPPHAPEAEAGILGCVLLDPNESMGRCMELGVMPEWFYDLRHQTLFGALLGMYEEREAIDLITVQQYLKDKGLLEEVGGIAFLSKLPDVVPSAANLEWYTTTVRDKFILRRMIHACTNIVAGVYDDESRDANEALDSAEADILRIRETGAKSEDVPIKQLVRVRINAIEDRVAHRGEVSGLPTGFPDFDKHTDGLKPGQMIVVAARPSLGKTTWVMNVAEHLAVDMAVPVGVFSAEMTAEDLVDRMMIARSRVSSHSIRAGDLAERDFPRLTAAAGAIAKSPLYIDDKASPSINYIRAKTRRWHRQYGIKLAILDYLQLAQASGRRNDNREQQVTEISAAIKGIAKELKIPFVVLCQLNRDIERDKKRKPRLADLRESGSIEQDADVVAMLYRPNASEDDEAGQQSEIEQVSLLLAKQRNGPRDIDLPLLFRRTIFRFESQSPIADNDVPQ